MLKKTLLILSIFPLGIPIGYSFSDPHEFAKNHLSATPSPTPSAKGNNCENPENGWKMEELVGRVKALRQEEIEYGYGDHKAELTRLVTFRPDGRYLKKDERWLGMLEDYNKITESKLVYDDRCRVIERTGQNNDYQIERTVISYARSGRVSQQAGYDTEGRLLWKSEATFDDKGYVVETNDTIQVHPEHFNPKRYDVYRYTKSVYENDATGNPIKQLDWKYDGTFYATYTMAYDAQSRLIRKLRLDEKNRPINLDVYVFDQLGRLKEELKYNSATYISVGELARGTLDSGFGVFQEGDRIVYEFDKNNNWIKKTEFDLTKNGKLSHASFRTLTYF